MAVTSECSVRTSCGIRKRGGKRGGAMRFPPTCVVMRALPSTLRNCTASDWRPCPLESVLTMIDAT